MHSFAYDEERQTETDSERWAIPPPARAVELPLAALERLLDRGVAVEFTVTLRPANRQSA
jgi:hypothetical protein